MLRDTTTGAAATPAMFPMKYIQSLANAVAGTVRKVMALSKVPKMLTPAAHHGTVSRNRSG